MTNEDSGSDLIARMRRLSVGSEGSAFSVVSIAPTVRSLDSNGSTIGGVLVGTPNSRNGALSPVSVKSSAKSSAKSLIVQVASKKASKKKKAATASQQHQQQQPNSPPLAAKEPSTPSPLPHQKNQQKNQQKQPPKQPQIPSCSPYWLAFPTFTPDPSSPFKDEFARLAKQMGWGTKHKRKQQVDALTAEINFHYGTCMDRLSRWQELCADVGIEEVPQSIKKCKRKLNPVLVNLYNLIDHRRNRDIKLIRFKSYGEFCKYTCNHRFPKECAKKEGFVIRVLLKKM